MKKWNKAKNKVLNKPKSAVFKVFSVASLKRSKNKVNGRNVPYNNFRFFKFFINATINIKNTQLLQVSLLWKCYRMVLFKLIASQFVLATDFWIKAKQTQMKEKKPTAKKLSNKKMYYKFSRFCWFQNPVFTVTHM